MQVAILSSSSAFSFSFLQEALVVSNALKPSQTQHVVQRIIGETEPSTFIFLYTKTIDILEELAYSVSQFI